MQNSLREIRIFDVLDKRIAPSVAPHKQILSDVSHVSHQHVVSIVQNDQKSETGHESPEGQGKKKDKHGHEHLHHAHEEHKDHGHDHQHFPHSDHNVHSSHDHVHVEHEHKDHHEEVEPPHEEHEAETLEHVLQGKDDLESETDSLRHDLSAVDGEHAHHASQHRQSSHEDAHHGSDHAHLESHDLSRDQGAKSLVHEAAEHARDQAVLHMAEDAAADLLTTDDRVSAEQIAEAFAIQSSAAHSADGIATRARVQLMRALATMFERGGS